MENTNKNKPQIEPLDMEAYQQKKCTWTSDGKNKSLDPHNHIAP